MVEAAMICTHTDELHAVEDGYGRPNSVIFQQQPRANRWAHDTTPEDDRAFGSRERHCDTGRAHAASDKCAVLNQQRERRCVEQAPSADLERRPCVVEEAASRESDVGFVEVIETRLDINTCLWISPRRPGEYRVFHHQVTHCDRQFSYQSRAARTIATFLSLRNSLFSSLP